MFLLSRTDSIGDVVLTLPMAGLIKRNFAQSTVIFLGRNYTRDVVALSEHVDDFISADDLDALTNDERVKLLRGKNIDTVIHVFPVKKIAQWMKAAGIPLRVGTTNRLYHWLYCNKLIRLSRKKSDLHEAQLNLKLLSWTGINTTCALEEIPSLYGFVKLPPLEQKWKNLLNNSRRKVILHPGSRGSAVEWGLDNFSALIQMLPSDRFQIFVSGSAQEGKQLKAWIEEQTNVEDLTGSMSLSQFAAFIASCDALVAASTGPLHIAAALGIRAVGLFSSRRPIHPGRWAPLGLKAVAMVADPSCEKCTRGEVCDCINRIKPSTVAYWIENEGFQR